MASPKKAERVWDFDVSDPRLHSNGFTIYKVTCKVFPIHAPENLTEIVIWKRYNDFKLLYKTLSSLHKNLHRREEFPVFAKPKLFGRFDDGVIEERRQSALALLNFVGRQQHLYRSPLFIEFFRGGEKAQLQSENAKKILRPEKLDLVQPGCFVAPRIDQDNIEVKTPQNAESIHSPGQAESETPTPCADGAPQIPVVSNGRDELSDTLWNLPQVPDNMSLNSFEGDDDPDLTDVESALSTPLPDADISFFDPLVPDPATTSPSSDTDGRTPSELPHTNSWLLSAFQTCADIETNVDMDNPPAIEDNSGIHTIFDTGQIPGERLPNCVATADGVGSSRSSIEDIDNIAPSISDTTSVSSSSGDQTDLSEFDPLKSRSLSKVECGKGDLDFSLRSSSMSSSTGTPEHKHSLSSKGSSSSLSASPRKMTGSTPLGSPRKRTPTKDSLSNIDLGGQYDYIYIAAHQISRAQESEAAGKYEMAHAYYMSGVGILLQGVQGDSNKTRREAVKRKTAQYLMRVEDLGKLYMTNETIMSPDVELDPSLAYLKAPTSELRNFKVLGTVDKVLLVLDKSTDSTYVIKTLHKSVVMPQPKRANIVATSCPYMVQFYKFYETDNAIYMLLQYASGGKLWNYIDAYLQFNHGGGMKDPAQICDAKDMETNVYSGQKLQLEEEDFPHDNGYSENASSSVKLDHGNPAKTDAMMASAKSVAAAPPRETKPCNLSPDKCSLSYVQLFGKDGTSVNQEYSESVVKYVKTPEDSGSADPHVPDLSSDGSKQFENGLNVRTEESEQSQITSSHSSPLPSDSDQPKCRNCSFSSAEDPTEAESAEPHSTSVSSFSDKLNQSAKFEEMLNGTKHSLDNFSINSLDEGDSMHRQDSNMSDHIQSIPEEGPQDGARQQEDVEGEVFMSDIINCDILASQNIGQILDPQNVPENGETVGTRDADSVTDTLDAESIVKNARELLKAVDESLQDDASSKPSTNLYLHPPVSVGSPEISIYDMNRSGESDTTITSSGGNASSTMPVNSKKDENLTKSDRQSSVDSSKGERGRNISGVRKMGIVRLNSKEPCRSASFECDLKSPSKSRLRTISAVFQQLDTALSVNMDVIKLPENCIRRWAAEIVICLNSLHSMGIICRDMNPNNVLLGERGHVLLTFFSQWSNTEQTIEQDTLEQLYVAPEVRGISGYNEVCDWWSMGAVLYELLVGRSLLSCHPGGVNSHTQLFLPSHLSKEASALLEELLHHNPRERLGSGITGVEEIKSHPFFNVIDWAGLTG